MTYSANGRSGRTTFDLLDEIKAGWKVEFNDQPLHLAGRDRRYPHLVRDDDKPVYLGELIKRRAANR